jgi:hypothetical protein
VVVGGGYYYSYMCMRLSSEVEYEYGTLVDEWHSGIIFLVDVLC